jgi:hypothetical protein
VARPYFVSKLSLIHGKTRAAARHTPTR